jgi:hypothetical protein
VLGAFGRLPYVGLLANILILPLVPWVMLLGVIALIVGAFLPFVAAVPALFADIIMRAILWTAGFLARYLPCAFEAQTGPIVTAMLFAWLLLLAYALKRLPRV